MIASLIIIFFITVNIYAQNTDYPFLKTDSNYFKLWKQCRHYDSLFEKFNRLQISGNEQIKVLHIGDSHVQADIFTSQIRKQFANNFFHLIGVPAIGFPYGILKSNQPVSIKVECTGNWVAYTSNIRNNNTVLGLTAYTNDSCANKIFININKKLFPNVNFNYLTLITNDFDSTIQITNQEIKLHSNTKLNDTIYLKTYSIANYKDSIILNLSIDSVVKGFKLYGIIPYNEDPGIVYHTIGINGAKASTFNNTVIFDFINFTKYDWLIISLGTNDIYAKEIDSTEIANNYKKLISKIKETNPFVPILLTTPMEHYFKRKYINSHVLYMKDIIYKTAVEYGCAVWDLYEVSGGKGSIDKWYANKLTVSDKIHLNTEGYQLVGNLFFEAFMNTYLNGFLNK